MVSILYKKTDGLRNGGEADHDYLIYDYGCIRRFKNGFDTKIVQREENTVYVRLFSCWIRFIRINICKRKVIN